MLKPAVLLSIVRELSFFAFIHLCQIRCLIMSSSIVVADKPLKLVKHDYSIVTITKQAYQVNQGLLFNRWAPPSVVLNNDTYVIDPANYEAEYSLCHQQDIVKGSNYTNKYKFIQEMLINCNEFNKFDFTFNKGFHIFDSSTGGVYECRILYAYCQDDSYNISDIKWRVFVDKLNINVIMSTYLIKKALLGNYSDKIIQMSVCNGMLINESKKKKGIYNNKKAKNSPKSK